MNLNTSGILRKYIINNFDFIVLLPSDIDEDYNLCEKLNLFMPQVPVIYINHYISPGYRKYLQDKVSIIMESPFNGEKLEKEMRKQLDKKQIFN